MIKEALRESAGFEVFLRSGRQSNAVHHFQGRSPLSAKGGGSHLNGRPPTPTTRFGYGREEGPNAICDGQLGPNASKNKSAAKHRAGFNPASFVKAAPID